MIMELFDKAFADVELEAKVEANIRVAQKAIEEAQKILGNHHIVFRNAQQFLRRAKEIARLATKDFQDGVHAQSREYITIERQINVIRSNIEAAEQDLEGNQDSTVQATKQALKKAKHKCRQAIKAMELTEVENPIINLLSRLGKAILMVIIGAALVIILTTETNIFGLHGIAAIAALAGVIFSIITGIIFIVLATSVFMAKVTDTKPIKSISGMAIAIAALLAIWLRSAKWIDQLDGLEMESVLLFMFMVFSFTITAFVICAILEKHKQESIARHMEREQLVVENRKTVGMREAFHQLNTGTPLTSDQLLCIHHNTGTLMSEQDKQRSFYILQYLGFTIGILGVALAINRGFGDNLVFRGAILGFCGTFVAVLAVAFYRLMKQTHIKQMEQVLENKALLEQHGALLAAAAGAGYPVNLWEEGLTKLDILDSNMAFGTKVSAITFIQDLMFVVGLCILYYGLYFILI